MGKGKFKNKPTGQRQFSTLEEIKAGTSSRPCTFRQREAEDHDDVELKEEYDQETVNTEKRKGTQGLIEIENPNLVKTKNVKLKDIDISYQFSKTSEPSRREREEMEKQKSRERYMRLQEQGKTEQARKDLERLSLIRQEREEAAKRREEEKAAKEQKKAEARKSQVT